MPVSRLSSLPAGRVGLLRDDHMVAFKRQAERSAQSSAQAAAARSLATLEAKSGVAKGAGFRGRGGGGGGGSGGRRQRCRQCEG